MKTFKITFKITMTNDVITHELYFSADGDVYKRNLVDYLEAQIKSQHTSTFDKSIFLDCLDVLNMFDLHTLFQMGTISHSESKATQERIYLIRFDEIRAPYLSDKISYK